MDQAALVALVTAAVLLNRVQFGLPWGESRRLLFDHSWSNPGRYESSGFYQDIMHVLLAHSNPINIDTGGHSDLPLFSFKDAAISHMSSVDLPAWVDIVISIHSLQQLMWFGCSGGGDYHYLVSRLRTAV